MFPEFQNGMDAYEQGACHRLQPAIGRGLSRLAARKHGSVQRLNQATGGAFRSFEEVQAPSRNLMAQPRASWPSITTGSPTDGCR